MRRQYGVPGPGGGTFYVVTLLLGLIGFSGVGICLNLLTGSHDLGFSEIIGYLWADDGSQQAFIVRDLRLPRIACAAGVGAVLALAGVLVRLITRNPLADPGLTGVTGGAVFGVAFCLTWISTAPSALIPAGIMGGILAASLTVLLAGYQNMQPTRLILAGVSVSIFFIAATSMVMILSKSSMQSLYFWMVGGFINRTWLEFDLFLPWALSGIFLTFLVTPVMGLLQFEDSMANSLGISAQKWRLTLAILSILLVAASVAIAGPLGFVGLVAGHLSQILLRHYRRHMGLWLLTSLLVGCGLTIWADTLSRLYGGGRLPAGVLTAILGGIFFIALFNRQTQSRV